jgi:hypothetical protein
VAHLFLLFLAAMMPIDLEHEADATALLPAEPPVKVTDERAPHLPPNPRERSKKETWLLEKIWRPQVHLCDADIARMHPRSEKPSKPAGPPNVQAEHRLAEPRQQPGSPVQVVATLYNVWNHEALPLIVGLPYKRPFQLFLRDHFTHEATQADTRLAGVLAAAAIKFGAQRVDVVSGYRSPKYNLMLRKKGRQVARESQHMQGTAVDFRVRGVDTEALREFAKGLRLGGVGYYPRTRFIHVDTGKVRYWSGS